MRNLRVEDDIVDLAHAVREELRKRGDRFTITQTMRLVLREYLDNLPPLSEYADAEGAND